MGSVNLVKLCVGAETVEDLVQWQQTQRAKGPDGLPRHVTRMWPRREAELLDGGSLYWVVKGIILVRQRILRLDEITGEDGIRRCALILDPALHRTQAAPRRPFQGWRYLAMEDAPHDLNLSQDNDPPIPPALSAALAEIGVR